MAFGASLSTDVVRRRGDEAGRLGCGASVRLLFPLEGFRRRSQVPSRTRIWASLTDHLPSANLFVSAATRS